MHVNSNTYDDLFMIIYQNKIVNLVCDINDKQIIENIYRFTNTKSILNVLKTYILNIKLLTNRNK